MNGDGIGRASNDLYGSRSFMAKLKVSWRYWFVEPNWAFKLSPVFLGFAVPGLLLWLLKFLIALRSKPPPYGLYNAEAARTDATLKFGAIIFTLVGGLLAFHYLLGDYYLYQILPMLPACCLAVWFFYDCCQPRVLRAIMLILVIALGVVPGTAFSLLGFKTPGIGEFRGQRIGPQQLFLLRHPGLSADEVRRLRYDHDVDMWTHLNDECTSSTILTHENRHLVIDPSITLFHLDEPEIQALWGKSREEKLAALKTMPVRESDGSTKVGIQYYLYVPNSQKHPINLRLGVEEWLDDPSVMTEILRSIPFDLKYKNQATLTPEELTRCNRLFRFNW